MRYVPSSSPEVVDERVRPSYYFVSKAMLSLFALFYQPSVAHVYQRLNRFIYCSDHSDQRPSVD